MFICFFSVTGLSALTSKAAKVILASVQQKVTEMRGEINVQYMGSFGVRQTEWARRKCRSWGNP